MFATLRFTNIRRRVARTLEAESGGNDPMAIALTLGLIAWIERPDDYGLANLTLLVVRQIGVGLLVGVVLGVAAAWLFARLPDSIGAFVPVASLAVAAVSFGAADVIGGSGFLAVYLVGLAVGSTPSRYRRQLVAFHEGLAFVAQVVLFIVLGLLVFPRELPAVAISGLALAALLVLVIRPAAVWVSTAFSDYTARERLLLGWAGLRGAVPIVLATFVLSSDVPEDDTIFNAVFFVVVVSTILQGSTLERIAERLGLLSPTPPAQEAPLEVSPLSQLELVDFAVAPDHAIAGAAVRETGLPRSAIIAVIRPRRRLLSTARQHDHRAPRPPIRASSALDAARRRGRLHTLATPRLTVSIPGELRPRPESPDQYQRSRAGPPNASSPTSATASPSQKLQTMPIRTPAMRSAPPSARPMPRVIR